MKFTKKNGGFTLVELIVVIAILAILAAIAVPAYSGYIKKANEAGDQTLLAAVNTAFAAACLENNQDSLTIGQKRAVKIVINDDGTIGSISPYGTDTTGADSVNGAFWRYFADNGGFKVFRSLYFNRNTGVFVENASEAITSGGLSVSVSDETKYLLQNSIWADEDKGMGAEGVMNQMGLVTEFTQDALEMAGSDALGKVIDDPKYVKSYAAAMGIKEEEMAGKTNEQIMEMIASKQDGWTNDQAAAGATNAMVLYAAQNAANQDPEEIKNLLLSGEAAKQIAATGNSDPGKMLSQAALAYGMYTAYAYANDPGDGSLIEKAENPQQLLKDIDKDPNFKTYLNSDAANADLQAYMAALGTVNDAAGDPATAENVLKNGFDSSNTDLLGLLNSIMGN